MATTKQITSQYRGERQFELPDQLRIKQVMTVEKALELLGGWLEKPKYQVKKLEEGTRVESLVEVPKAEGDSVVVVAGCPAGLVDHLRQLIYNRERTGRLASYFGKVMSEVEKGKMPSWFEFAVEALQEEDMEKKSRKGKKGKGSTVNMEIQALKRNWRPHMAQYFLFQSMLFSFYENAMQHIVGELKASQIAQKDPLKWQEEVWEHPIFAEYIVRERWGAWDLDVVNDPRWENAKSLHPLHPGNAKELGE
jgi:hypothetical protein